MGSWTKVKTEYKTYTQSELINMLKEAGYTNYTSITAAIVSIGSTVVADVLKVKLPPPMANILIAGGLALGLTELANAIQNNINVTNLANMLQTMANNGGTRVQLATDYYEWESGSGNHHNRKTESRHIWLP